MSFLAQKRFETIDQELFAEASGDWNPMHLDPLAARRTQMGAPVVHGMHTALLCLDVFARSTHDPPVLSAITASFSKPVYVGDNVTFLIARQSPLRLTAEVDGVKVMTIDLTLGSQKEPRTDKSSLTNSMPMNRTPRERSFTDIEKASGMTERITLSSASERLFPNAARWMGPARIGGLAALSRLVGMECPGLHSIFIRFTMSLVAGGPADVVEFSVLSTDDRFRRIKLSVEGGGLKGVVDAAVRTPPVCQPSLREIAGKVKPGSFAGQRVLVIGGSRGIGEYTAKAIAAGGGHVTATYTVGMVEAQALLAEIKDFGGEADLLRYDVRLPAAAQLEKLKIPPTHVYYFATGRIFGRRGNEFSPSLYQEFHQFYVEGFYDLCSALRKMTEQFSVFYPSSVAVAAEDRPKGLTEYAMAKAAGELLCADMKWLLPGMKVMMKRLPRLPTDQTATLGPVAGEESMDTLLPIILEMQR
ncbi:MAG TPA: SDR family NAD(P)-dependent oxidoreductase [bacterium]|nr:SDR family NAD(P)-dependent oxidoreductase [bacterium]